MTSFGVPLGAQSPCQIDDVKPGSPASSTVGISGADGKAGLGGDGVGPDLAARTCGSEFGA